MTGLRSRRGAGDPAAGGRRPAATKAGSDAPAGSGPALSGPADGGASSSHQTRPDGRLPGSQGFEVDAPLFVISVAAQLAGMHAQTLRSYDREGLVSPGRTTGGGRRYSQRDIELLREVQRLSQDEGVNRAGIRRIIELEALVDVLREQLDQATTEIASLRADLIESRMDAANAAANAIAGLRRDVVPWQEPSTALVAWRRQRRR